MNRGVEVYIVAVDCGTQSLRAIVFDQQGIMLANNKVMLEPYSKPEPECMEISCEFIYDAMIEAVSGITAIHPELADKIEGITVTTQRDGVIVVDENGHPLRPAIIWADQRRIQRPKPMALHHRLAFSVVGMGRTVSDLSRNFKGHWLQEYEPEVWEKTHKYLQISGYLNYRLTGAFRDSLASQIGHIPFCYKKFRWERQHSLKHDIFHIHNSKFPELTATGHIIGSLLTEVASSMGLKAGIPVIASGSDKGCETLGVGCLDNETVSLSLGSQASIQTTTNRYYETIPLIPPFQSVIPGYYNPEIQVYRGYWMISWFLREFGDKEIRQAKDLSVSPVTLFNKGLDRIRPGADGLVLNPYWGAGVKRSEARGAIIGFNDRHTRMHVYRAIIEGVGFALLDGMHQIEKRSGHRINKIMVSGGGAESDTICQITSDMFNLPVHRVQTYETSALGASIAGYVGLGIFKDYHEGVGSMVHITDTFYPNKKNHQVYHRLYKRIYKGIYPRLRPIYRRYGEVGF